MTDHLKYLVFQFARYAVSIRRFSSHWQLEIYIYNWRITGREEFRPCSSGNNRHYEADGCDQENSKYRGYQPAWTISPEGPAQTSLICIHDPGQHTMLESMNN